MSTNVQQRCKRPSTEECHVSWDTVLTLAATVRGPRKHGAEWKEPDTEIIQVYDCTSKKCPEEANPETESRLALARGRGRGTRS